MFRMILIAVWIALVLGASCSGGHKTVPPLPSTVRITEWPKDRAVPLWPSSLRRVQVIVTATQQSADYLLWVISEGQFAAVYRVTEKNRRDMYARVVQTVEPRATSFFQLCGAPGGGGGGRAELVPWHPDEDGVVARRSGPSGRDNLVGFSPAQTTAGGGSTGSGSGCGSGSGSGSGSDCGSGSGSGGGGSLGHICSAYTPPDSGPHGPSGMPNPEEYQLVIEFAAYIDRGLLKFQAGALDPVKAGFER